MDKSQLEKELGIFNEIEGKTEWEITDYKSAEWAMDTWYLADARIRERTAFVKEKMDKVLERLERMCAEDKNTKDRMEKALRKWGVEFLKRQKTKTVKFVHGSISYRDLPEAIVVDDQDALVADAFMKRRDDKEFTEKYGTIHLKYDLSFVEEGGAAEAELLNDILTRFVKEMEEKLKIGVKINTSISHAEVKKFYEKSGYLFAGCHIRPKLYNATFKIEPISNTGEINDKGESKAIESSSE